MTINILKKITSKGWPRLVVALVVIVMSTGLIATQIPFSDAASTGGATLSITPSTGSYTVGQSVTLSLYENSGTTAVNVVEFELSYPSSLTYASTDLTNSAFAIPVASDGGNGTVSITRGTITADLTGSQLIGTVTFTATSAGTATVAYESGVQLITTVNNVNDFGSSTPATLTINSPTCPSGDTGTYPNCTSPTCQSGYTGTYPNCVKDTCPSGDTGTYPNCVLPKCPSGDSGTYPNCVAPTSTPGPTNPPTTTTTTNKTPSTTGQLSVTTTGSSTPVTVGSNQSAQVTQPATVEPTTVAENTSTPDAIVKVEYYLNNKLIKTVTTAPFTYKLNTTNLVNGTYTLTTKTIYRSGDIDVTNQHIIVNNPESLKQVGLAAEKYSPPILLILLLLVVVWLLFRFRKHLSNFAGGLFFKPAATGGPTSTDTAFLDNTTNPSFRPEDPRPGQVYTPNSGDGHVTPEPPHDQYPPVPKNPSDPTVPPTA